jgi:hypothetical protein
VRTDWDEPVRGCRVDMDWDEAGRLGISPSFLGASLAMGTTGHPAGTIWEGDRAVKLLLKEDSLRSGTLDGFRHQLVSSMPLGAVGAALAGGEGRTDWTEGDDPPPQRHPLPHVRVDPRRDVLASACRPASIHRGRRSKFPAGGRHR